MLLFGIFAAGVQRGKISDRERKGLRGTMDSDPRHHKALAKRVDTVCRGQDVYVAGKLNFKTQSWEVYRRTEPAGEENQLIAEIPDDWIADELWGQVEERLREGCGVEF